ncbi:483cd34a-f107-45f2-b288-498000ea85ce [Thermothielavioides terrestris]|uniref:483cd34a-f107-45f2-b288-498000ea85ce n=1 Tax=Thermothielavioides terrestris TaxID=2587410 RepID=A0A446BXX9_9PEZI|nr:483cd34a-f107-45f2-b288-498000ea85ce [Thermothielavioides terrestris]
MSRGNQREKAREATQKKLAAQKKAHGMSGSELAKAKEIAAQKMREKQAAADARKAAEAAAAKAKK